MEEISLCQALGQGRLVKKASEQWKSKQAINVVSPKLPRATFFNALFPLSWSLEQARRRWKKIN